MNRKLKILLGIVLVLLVLSALQYTADMNKVLMDDIQEITVEQFNELSLDKKINYTTTEYIVEKDTLYIIDESGNEYRLVNASKKNLGENSVDEYYKQFFKDRKPVNKLTGITSINYTSVLLTAASLSFYGVIIYILIMYTKGFGLKKKDVRHDNKGITVTTFADVKGHKEAKRDIQFIIDFLNNPNKYKEMNVRFPKGIMLYGPPGTGKTLLAKAIAGESGAPIFTVSGSDFIEMYVGLGAKRVRELFDVARKEAPSIIFIDEIDAVAQKRVGSEQTREHDQTLNALLACLDGFTADDNILVIASTNRLDVLDPALIRPGRFDKHIEIGYPDTVDRKEIAELYLKDKPLEDDVTAEYIASQTFRFSGAMIDSLINEAALIAALNNHKKISREDVSHAMLKVVTGGDKKIEFNKDNTQTKLIALHEAGHALVYRKLCKMPVPKISIVPTTTGALGWTMTSPEDVNMQLISKSDMEDQIMGLYAGRACEEVYFEGDKSKVTTGASNDIKQATKMIYSMINEYGFDDTVGNINITSVQEYIKNLDNSSIISNMSDKSNKIYDKTLVFVTENYHTIEAIADLLVEKETIDQQQLDSIIEESLA